MTEPTRKKSPRAPSLSLGEAIERVTKIYKAEGRHPAPLEVTAKHLGYSSARHGAALQVFASLKYFGLVERPKDGQLAVTREFEIFIHTPDDREKAAILINWLKTPPVFSELLEKYKDRLPSDGNIKFDLITRGFLPSTAEACASVFRRSVQDAQYFDTTPIAAIDELDKDNLSNSKTDIDDQKKSTANSPEIARASSKLSLTNSAAPIGTLPDVDRIPIRLAGGRRAIIEIPTPFFSADKKRLKAHIDLLLTDDDEISNELENE